MSNITDNDVVFLSKMPEPDMDGLIKMAREGLSSVAHCIYDDTCTRCGYHDCNCELKRDAVLCANLVECEEQVHNPLTCPVCRTIAPIGVSGLPTLNEADPWKERIEKMLGVQLRAREYTQQWLYRCGGEFEPDNGAEPVYVDDVSKEQFRWILWDGLEWASIDDRRRIDAVRSRSYKDGKLSFLPHDAAFMRSMVQKKRSKMEHECEGNHLLVRAIKLICAHCGIQLDGA